MPDLKKLITLEALQAALPSWLKSSSKPSYTADEISDTNTTNKFVTSTEKNTWNAKGTYSKPSGGIPKTDMSSLVQSSLDKADSAVQTETDPTVPSWAKQTNKPSYTQDEVTDGTTYKRVTSTEKNTWNSKQNALTTTQMNAVNSGATQAKIDQIHYNTNNGVKNVLKFDTIGVGSTISDSFVTGGVRFTRNSDNSITVTRESSNTNSAYCVFILNSASVRIDSLCDNDHYLIGCPTGGGSSSFELLAGTINARDYGSGVLLPTLSSGQSNIIPQMVVRPAFTGTITFKPMIITKATYNAGFTDYQPYTLPNTVITPALAEEIDAGAKNKLDFANLTLSNNNKCTVTKTDSNITVASNENATWAYVSYKIPTTLKAGKYVLQGKVTNTTFATNTKGIFFVASAGSGTFSINESCEFTSNGTYYTAVTIPTTGTYYIIFSPNWSSTTNSTNTATISEVMVCTLADWKVSQKHVPYCKSNSELTGIIATDTVTKQYWIKATDLNNVKTSGYYKFTGGPANTPYHSASDYGMLIVSTFDNYITQLCHKYYIHPGLYARLSTDSGVTWSDWVCMTSSLSRGSRLTNGTDLNSQKDIGAFYAEDANHAATLTHAPWTNLGFKLTVSSTHQSVSSGDGILQEAIAILNGQVVSKKRCYYYLSGSWTWSEWE